MREELLEKAQYKNLEEREELKNYFTQPPDMDMTKKTIVFSTPSDHRKPAPVILGYLNQ